MGQARRKRRELRVRRQAQAPRNTQGPPEPEGQRGRGRLVVLIVAAVLLIALVGGVLYGVLGGGSSKPKADAPVVTGSNPLAALAGHQLSAPECMPVTGPEWVYPKGPPVKGLPPVIANIRSDLYEAFAINYSCKDADVWIHKLSKLKIPIRVSGNSTVLHGPKGWYCTAFPDANGLAYAGACQSGGGGHCAVGKHPAGEQYANGHGCKLVGGNKAFGWNWNVENRRVVFQQNDKGVVQLIHLSGSDTNVVFRYLNGSYQLQVLNTSGIGYLNGFIWEPSAGWKVTKITSVSGGACSLTAAGKISCHGNVQPPTCLCAVGGSVTINFAASPTTKKSGFLFGGAPWQFKVTKMTPVPYIIPGSLDQARKRFGV